MNTDTRSEVMIKLAVLKAVAKGDDTTVHGIFSAVRRDLGVPISGDLIEAAIDGVEKVGFIHSLSAATYALTRIAELSGIEECTRILFIESDIRRFIETSRSPVEATAIIVKMAESVNAGRQAREAVHQRVEAKLPGSGGSKGDYRQIGRQPL